MGSPASASHGARMLRLLARLNPELWDLFPPHGPAAVTAAERTRPAGGASEAALNPQPLPPRDVLRLAVRQTVHSVAQAAIVAQRTGGDAREILREAGEDWCPTPPHRKIPWPKHWPAPWPPGDPAPVDPGFATPAVQAAAGLAFQAYADGVADTTLRTAFADLADRLCDAALYSAGSA